MTNLGLPTLLTILFVVLKLTHVIAWGWLWVLSPLWISFAVGFILFIVLMKIATKKFNQHRL